MQSNKSERIGWYFYDFANSAFYTTVITVFLGPYLTTLAKNTADPNGYINILGLNISAGSYFPYIVSLSVFLQIFLLPYAGSLADYTNMKKQILGFFAYLGAFSTMGLYFLDESNLLLGGLLFIIANLSFGISAVMYNAYLNDIADNEKKDTVSSIGWAFGYMGGGIILGANLFLYSNAASFGISESIAIRISMCSAGL